MLIQETSLPDVYLVEPQNERDSNGNLTETVTSYLGNPFANAVQDNTSLSSRPHKLRDRHPRRPPNSRALPVRCVRGALLDVAADNRVGLPKFRNWTVFGLSDKNRRCFFAPKRIFHWFPTLFRATLTEYKCSAFYTPESEATVRWDGLGIALALLVPLPPATDAAADALEDFINALEFGKVL